MAPMIRTGILLIVLVVASNAAISNFTSKGSTATETIISYTAPDPNPCLITVTNLSTLTPTSIVYDVDPNTFLNSNLDLLRLSTTVETDGLTRTVTIGQRTSQLATAGPYLGVRRFSRALQNYTPHSGQLTCPSTGDTLAFNFTTSNIPLGQSYGDPYLSDPTNPGTQPWPEYLGAITDSHIDPLTGSYEQLLSLHATNYVYWQEPANPVLFGAAYDQGQLPCDTSGPWVNPCGAGVTIGGTGVTSIGNSAAPLVLRPPLTSNTAWAYGQNQWSTAYVLDQVGANLTGVSTVAPHPVAACLGMNGGASCANAPQIFTFGTASSEQHVGGYAPGTYGTSPWILDSNPRISMEETAPNSGTGQISTAGPDILTWTGGSNNWSLNWVQGGNGRIRVSTVSAGDACAANTSTSAEYTILGFVPGTLGLGGNNLLLNSNLPTPTGTSLYWCANNFVLMIWRPDAPNITDGSVITLTGANLNVLESYYPSYPNNGASTPAFNTLYQNGYFSMFGGLSWINPTTGASVWYGVPYTGIPAIANPWGSDANVCVGGETPNIDNSQSKFNCLFTGGISGSGPMMLEMNFAPTSVSTQPPPYPNGSQIGNASIVASANTPYSQTWSNGITYTNLSPQNTGGVCETLLCQIAALYTFTPGFNLQQFNTTSPYGTVWTSAPSSGVTAITFTNGGDSLAWIMAFQPGNLDPTQAGSPAGPRLIGAINTFNTPPQSPSSIYSSFVGHSLHAITEDGNGWFSLNGHAQAMVNTTITPIPATSTTTCASFGFAGNNNPCIQLQIVNHTSPAPCVSNCTGYEPYNTSPGTLFTGAPGELRTTQIGDTFSVGGMGYNTGANEMMQMLGKGTGPLCAGTDQCMWVAQRAVYNGKQLAISATPITLHWIAPSLAPAYGSGEGASTTITVHWNPTGGCNGAPDPFGECLTQDTNETYGHGEWRDGGEAGTTNVIPWNVYPSGFDAWPTAYQVLVGQVPGIFNFPFANSIPLAAPGVGYVSYSPPFAGAWGQPWTGNGGTHPSPAAATASNWESIRAFDEAQIQGCTGCPTFTWVTGQLYVNTPAPKDVIDPDDYHGVDDNIAPINRKLMAQGSTCGHHPVIDISGPNAVIPTDATGSYQVAFVRVAGEAYPGSTVGQIYLNCPGLVTKGCGGSALHGSTPLGDGNDACVGNIGNAANAVRQLSLTSTDFEGAGERTLVTATSTARMNYGFENARGVDSWLLFPTSFLQLERPDMWMAKLNPYPAADTVARWSFVPVTLTLNPTIAATTNALIQFGYQEYGAPVALDCTSRHDGCEANGLPLSLTQPFAFVSENPSGQPCTPGVGCKIKVPAISQRALYYRVVYRDAGNNVLEQGPVEAIAVP